MKFMARTRKNERRILYQLPRLTDIPAAQIHIVQAKQVVCILPFRAFHDTMESRQS